MLHLPENRIYPSKDFSLRTAGLVACECFSGWTEDQYQQLHQLLARIGIHKYVAWESSNKLDIDAYCHADTSQRKKTKKWQASGTHLLLPYACWRRLVQAQLLQDELEQLKSKDSPSRMKEYRLALVVLQDIETLPVYVPFWCDFFRMPSPFSCAQDGSPLLWYLDIDFECPS